MNNWLLRIIWGIGIVICLISLGGCGGIPTGGQRLNFPKRFPYGNVDNIYIFTSGQRGKAMADQSEKSISVQTFDKTDNELGSLLTSCYCGILDWDYKWEAENILTIVFYERPRKDRIRGKDLFNWKLRINPAGSLTELKRTPQTGPNSGNQ